MAKKKASKDHDGGVATKEPRTRSVHPLKAASNQYAAAQIALETVRTRIGQAEDRLAELHAEGARLLDVSASAKDALDAALAP